MSFFKSVMTAGVCVAALAAANVANAGDEAAAAAASEVALVDIVDTAVAADGFNTLVAAVQAADLVETLKGEGPFTVFAPTDEAFAALPEGTLEELLKPENKAKLQGILTYHVLSGAVLSTDITSDMSVDSVQGEALAVALSDEGVAINDASVIAVDIKTSNGVIHVIDKVLLPTGNTESR